MTAKGLTYAEATLGVNSVYESVLKVRESLDEAYTEISTLRDAKRVIEDAIETRELELIADEHGKHPTMSVAAMERHLKLELPKDTQLGDLRSKLRATVSSIEGLEYDIKMFDTDIRIAVARMNELGGYLQYLAAIKQASTPSKPEKPETQA